MKRGILALLLLPSVAAACMWDYDALSTEAKGLPTALDAIAGRLPINPPQYYQRRIELSKAALQRNPADYAQYDNLAVAYDKLGRSEEAIATIELKRAWLEKNKIAPTADPMNDPWYRYHANLGTFYAHQWYRNQDTVSISKLDSAIKELEAAIQINPNAHFGREKLQLQLIQGLRQGTLRDIARKIQSAEPDASAEAIIAIMTLGSGVDSPDMIAALTYTFPLRSAVLADLAGLRLQEMKAQGAEATIGAKYYGSTYYENELQVQYKALRANAKNYRRHRDEYILSKLKAGKHPDTDADFWKDYVETPRIDLTTYERPRFVRRTNWPLILTLGGASLIGLTFLFRKALGAVRLGKRA